MHTLVTFTLFRTLNCFLLVIIFFILQLQLIFNGKLLFSFLFPAFALFFCVPDLIPQDMCAPDELVCCSQNHQARSPIYLAASLKLFSFGWM